MCENELQIGFVRPSQFPLTPLMIFFVIVVAEYGAL